MIRSFCLALAVLAFTPASAQELQRWQSRSGKSLEAKLVEQDRKTVTLQTPEGRKLTVAKSQLDVEQATATHLRWLRDQDRSQYELTHPHLGEFGYAPDATVGVLLSLHKEFDTAPYAGLAAGILMAREQNKPKPAESVFRSVIERIQYQRRFDASTHQTTLASAVNNLAVCLVRQKKADEAAARITALCEDIKDVPLAAYHNATLLQNLSANTPFVTLRAAAKEKLLRAVSRHSGVSEAEALPNYFVYSLANDLPAHEEPAVNPNRDEPDEPPLVNPEFEAKIQPHHKKHGAGTGFVIADGLVLTNRHCVETALDPDPVIVVAAGEGARLARHVVRSVTVPVDNPELDLALLEVEQLDLPRLPFAAENPKPGSAVVVLGFPHSSIYGNQKFATSGSVNAVMAHAGRPCVVTDALINRGNSGGPALDAKGCVVGVAFAFTGHQEADESPRGLLVQSVAAERWINDVFPDVSLQASDGGRTPASLEVVSEAALPSVVLVELYSDSRLVPANPQGEKRLSADELGLYSDHWCLFCDGRGVTGCTNRGCANGKILRRAPVQIGINPTTGERVFANKVFFDPCKTCKGNGKLPCRLCQNGKY